VIAEGPIDWEGGTGQCSIAATITQGNVQGSGDTGSYDEGDPDWECSCDVQGSGRFQPGPARAHGVISGNGRSRRRRGRRRPEMVTILGAAGIGKSRLARAALAAAAARWLGAAGRAALDRGDMPAGANLLERTAALLDRDAPERASVVPELGLALVQLGRLREAEDILLDATRAAAARRDAVAEAHARVAHLVALVQVDPEGAAEQVAARAPALRRTLSVAGDDVGLARLFRAEALQHWLLGQTARAEAAWMRAMRHSRQAGDDQGVSDSLVWLASAALLGPTHVPRAISWCEAIVDHLRADRRSLALSMRPLAGLHGMAGRFEVAQDLFGQSSAIHEELGVGMHAAVAHDEALIALAAGDAVRAEALLRPGLERLEAIGERALLATTAGMIAIALLDQRRDDEAWELSCLTEESGAESDLRPRCCGG
jgi:tetratricopeptide (TPR) repeat protein